MTFLSVSANIDHISNVRNMLQQAGITQHITTRDEPQVVYSGSGELFIHVFNPPIAGCAGVWSGTDVDHEGENFYDTLSGSSIVEPTGKVVLASGALGYIDRGDDVLVTYRYQAGLTDSQILMEVASAKSEINLEFEMNWTYTVSTDDRVHQLAILTMYAVAVKYCILALNSSNAIQGGFSYRLGELDVQTKLWGEGMSMGELFKMYKEKIRVLKNTLKLAYDGAPIVIINRRSISAPYNQRAFPANAQTATVRNAAIFTSSGKVYVVGEDSIYEGYLTGMNLFAG